MTSEKSARIYGVRYWKGELISSKIDKIDGANKRGIWQYDISSLDDKQLKKYAADLEAGLINQDDYIASPFEREKEVEDQKEDGAEAEE